MIGDTSVPTTIISVATDLTAVGAVSEGLMTSIRFRARLFTVLVYVKKRAMDTLDKIKSGAIRLSIDDRISYPSVVTD